MTRKTQKKLRKLLTLVSCAVLLVCVTVVGTVAYLTAKETVTNTFVVGNIQMKLDEADVDNSSTDKDRDQNNTYNHIKPNDVLEKDPIVWLQKNSEKAYVFIQVTNEIAGLEVVNDSTKPTIATQITTNGWTKLNDNGVYYKTVDASTMNASEKEGYTDYIELATFDKVYISSTIDNATLQNYNNKTVSVVAYAIQYDGFENNVNGAWTAVQNAYTAA